MIHLDTNFVIRGFTPGTPEDAAVRRWLGAGRRVAVSSPAWAEFLCGPVSPAIVGAAAAALGPAVAFVTPDAVTAADLFNVSGRRRGSMIDCMIAAVALAHGAMLATRNQADFARFATRGLAITVG